jgi:hypothetical protein
MRAQNQTYFSPSFMLLQGFSVTVKPRFMPPGLPRYTETYDKSNATEPSWAMRRDLRLGTTSGQIFMTTGEADTFGMHQGHPWAQARAGAQNSMLELELTLRAQLLPLSCRFFRRHAHPACTLKLMLSNNHS